MTQPGYEGIKREFAYQKGICDVCRMPVFADQARCKNQRGAYAHAQCVAAASDDRVGAAGVVPPTAPTPELKEVKGICDVCRMPVLVDQARCKNQRGAYVHAQCAAATGDARVGFAGVPPPIEAKPELKEVKGICEGPSDCNEEVSLPWNPRSPNAFGLGHDAQEGPAPRNTSCTVT